MAAYKRLFSVVSGSTNNFLNFLSTRNSILLCQPCATYKSRLIEKKLGIPPRPKRPVSPFILFTMQQRPRIVKENPDLASKDVMKKLAEEWKIYDPTQKETLRKDYLNELQEYTKQTMAYEQNLTADQKRSIKAEKFRAEVANEKLKMKTRLRELGKPKKPPTTFILYMLSRVHTKSKDLKFSEWLAVAAKEWNAAPEDVRANFEEETKKLMEQYKKEMIDWEEKMIKLGHIDVVRKQVLMDLKGKSMHNEKS